MNKTLSMLIAIVIILALLGLSSGTAFAAPLKAASLTLVEVRNNADGGVIFVFAVSGDFSKHELRNGTVHIPGVDGDQDLYCNRVAEDTLHCTTGKAAGGKNVTVRLAGFIFWAYVPASASRDSAPSQYCYGVYDWLPGDEGEGDGDGDFEFDGGIDWVKFATHCQDAPANHGDMLYDFYNPDWDTEFDYIFLSESPACEFLNPLSLSAYYYDCGVPE